MFRSLLCKSGGTLKRAASIINGESSSSSLAVAAKYFLFTFQNQNVISNSRVTSIFCSLSTTSRNRNGNGNVTCSDSDYDSEFVVSYLINSCGLTQEKAVTVSKKIKFKTTSNPDSVLALLRTHGFTESHISSLITRYPAILSSNPDKTLKPRFDFFISKGIHGLDLTNFISNHPQILRRSNGIIPCFDILKSILQTDQNVIKIINRSSSAFCIKMVKKLMSNLELLRHEGVPETKISKYLIQQPRSFMQDHNRFKNIVQKVNEMGFNPSSTMYLVAIIVLTSMSEASWGKKMDVYKRLGWSEDEIYSAFRKDPSCMRTSEKKITAVMNFLVNEMGYDSLNITQFPKVFSRSLKERLIPRCSVLRILVSKGLIKKMISLSAVSTMVDKCFLEKFVMMYEQEVPELVKVFQGQLSYQDVLQN